MLWDYSKWCFGKHYCIRNGFTLNLCVKNHGIHLKITGWQSPKCSAFELKFWMYFLKPPINNSRPSRSRKIED
jgi:hypothetical protein